MADTEDLQESSFVEKGRGKWGKGGVPHKGWKCVDVEDLGEPHLVCDMCESQQIRYAHYMKHPDYEFPLVVGCVCAGNMEQDLASAKNRDAKMRSRATQRKKWTDRHWRVSHSGNYWLITQGWRVVIYRRPNIWNAMLVSTDGWETKHFVNKEFWNLEKAMLAAFDKLTWVLMTDS